MLGALDVLLNKDPLITERRFCAGLAEFEGTFKLVGLLNDLHADSTTACGGFDDDGIADFIGEGTGNIGTGNGFRGAFGRWQSCGLHSCACLDFVAEQRDHARGGTDEGDPLFFEASDESGVLCKESVAWVNSVALKLLGCLHHCFDVKIRIQRVGAIIWISDVGHLNGKRKAIFSTMNNGGFDAHISQCSQDTKSDFSSVGNQHPLEAHDLVASEAIYEQSGPTRTIFYNLPPVEHPTSLNGGGFF